LLGDRQAPRELAGDARFEEVGGGDAETAAEKDHLWSEHGGGDGGDFTQRARHALDRVEGDRVLRARGGENLLRRQVGRVTQGTWG
jgi:hypothetical protein